MASSSLRVATVLQSFSLEDWFRLASERRGASPGGWPMGGAAAQPPSGFPPSLVSPGTNLGSPGSVSTLAAPALQDQAINAFAKSLPSALGQGAAPENKDSLISPLQAAPLAQAPSASPETSPAASSGLAAPASSPNPFPASTGWVVALGAPDGVPSPPSGASPLKPGPRAQILVQWTAEATEVDRAQAAAQVGGTRKTLIHTATMKARGEGVLEVIRLPETAKLEEVLAAYEKLGKVRYAELDRLVQPQVVSNDPSYTNGSLWGMYSSDSPTAVGPAGTSNVFGSQAESAWNKGFTGSKSVFVGIIDEGFDYTHPDLAANAWLNPFDVVDGIDNDGNGYIDDVRGWDFFNNDNSVYDGVGDDHGTHVAGTVGAVGGNALGVVGVSWNVSMISAKFLGDTGGYTSGAIMALDYLTDLKTRHGINIVASNNSWGGGGYSQALHDAIIRAAKQDILFIAAAGNSTSNNDATANYPSNYNTTVGTSSTTAATYDAVVAVASITNTGALSSFSSYGSTTVDLGAPGSAITSTLPGNTYGSYSGTSMATPHVSGAVALYAASNPGATAAEIRTALLASTTPTASLAGKTVTGGRLNVDALLGLGSAPSLAITASQVSLGEGQSGATLFSFQITRSGSTSGTTQVSWAVSGSGSNPADAADFVSGQLPSGTVSFAPGETSKTITVEVQGDSLLEGTEAFAVTLSNPSNGASLSTASATSSILNDDGVLTAANPTAISIPSLGASNPFPSTVTVAGGGNAFVASMEITLSNLSHTWPDDLDILLVGPTGAKALLMSDAGGSTAVNGISLTFTSLAPTALPDASTLITGSYRPVDFEPNDIFNAPAPAGPYTANLSVFNGTDPTGTWSLYVQDDASGDSGSIAGGWSLSIVTAPSALAIQATEASQSFEGNSGSTPLSFLVTRSGDVTGSASVGWAVAGSGATPATGLDFVGGILPSGTLSFAPGEASKTITLSVAGDSTVESTETFTVSLSAPAGAVISAATATGTILNDDVPLISISSAPSVVEGQSSPQSVSYTVSLSAASSLPVSVQYATADGTATAGLDYTAVAGTLTFAPGTTSATISVPILNDNLDEVDETFSLSLSNPTNGQLSTSTATTTISDTLIASVTTILPANVENLLLGGSSAIGGTGNDGANRLTGNAANNSLSGAGGDDILNGGAGSDTLTGGAGADTFVMRFGQSRASARDRITDFAIGTDRIAILKTDNASLVPTSLTQAANTTTTNISTLVNNAFSDADGFTSGKQALAVNAATIVVATSASLNGTYLVINDGVAGYQSANDLVVNISNYTGTLARPFTPSDWFV
jgi:subtilisin family serine protease/subtilisin-like proprotein convertase family protein